MNSNVTAAWRAHKRGALLRQSLLHADPPDLHPGLRRPPVEAHADEREPAQRRPRLGAEEEGRQAAAASRSPKPSATTTSSASIRASATSCRATSRRATPSRCATKAAASARAASPSTSISRTRSSGSAPRSSRRSYGNLFDMYQKITDEDPYKVPMRIYPAIHYTMGGLWVDYNLMSNVPGPARARRSELLRSRRQPPRRQRADAGAGRRLLRHPVHARRLPRRATPLPKVTTDHDAFKEAADDAQSADRQAAVGQGQSRTSARSTASSGRIMWDDVGMARTEAGLRRALAADSEAARGVLAERLGARAGRTT